MGRRGLFWDDDFDGGIQRAGFSNAEAGQRAAGRSGSRIRWRRRRRLRAWRLRRWRSTLRWVGAADGILGTMGGGVVLVAAWRGESGVDGAGFQLHICSRSGGRRDLRGVPPALAKDGSSLWRLAAVLVPATAAAMVAFGCVWNLYAALGVLAFPALAVVLALVLILFAPVFCEADQGAPALFGGFLSLCIGATLIFTTGAVLLPAYSAGTPDRLNISYSLDADSGKAQWLVEPESQQLPASFRQVMTFNATPEKAFPWSASPSFMADAGRIDLATPTLTIENVTVSGQERTRSREAEIGARGARRVDPVFTIVGNRANVTSMATWCRRPRRECCNAEWLARVRLSGDAYRGNGDAVHGGG